MNPSGPALPWLRAGEGAPRFSFENPVVQSLLLPPLRQDFPRARNFFILNKSKPHHVQRSLWLLPLKNPSAFLQLPRQHHPIFPYKPVFNPYKSGFISYLFPPHIPTPPGHSWSNFHPVWIKESFPSLLPAANNFFGSQQPPDYFPGVLAQFTGGSAP